MIAHFLFFVSFHHDWSIAQKGGCGDNNNDCCAETIWNETLGRCIGCMPGYFGQYCNITCEYPRYGMRCMGKCDCEQDRCNFVTGCPDYEPTTMLKLSSFICGGLETTGVYPKSSFDWDKT
ncbi:platelet endothelial aggregation receptor 1-like isoform X1 [Ostrea edulis]|uniref:platelet endothelial aggregation receptor 1-like isoform X1 n=1 Tax=Ostrea edulis TaxID=37623 RepID=UPI0024AEA47F|nr:platelet endothelial aggregation receptor 1-like isoform X1 [Ostrea edulis]